MRKRKSDRRRCFNNIVVDIFPRGVLSDARLGKACERTLVRVSFDVVFAYRLCLTNAALLDAPYGAHRARICAAARRIGARQSQI